MTNAVVDEHPIERIYPSIAKGLRVTPVAEIIRRLEKTPNYTSLPFIEKLPSLVVLMLDNQYREHIQQIYLFGSYAYGDPNEDSDIDLFVIIDDCMLPLRRDVCMKIKKPLRNEDLIPCDLLVYNEETYNKYKNDTGIEHVIKRFGVLIYERK